MKIQNSIPPQGPANVKPPLPVTISQTRIPHDSLASSGSSSKGLAGILGKLWTNLKNFINRLLNAIIEVLGLEATKLDIIEGMFYDQKGQAKEFASSFKENLNACIQAAFFSPEDTKELIDDHKSKYKKFCKELNRAIQKKGLSNQLQEYKRAASEALTLLWVDFNQEQLKQNVHLLKKNIPLLSQAFSSFCKQISLKLENAHRCRPDHKEQFESLKRLFDDYFPKIAYEMSRQPSMYETLISNLVNLKGLKDAGNGIVKILTDRNNATTNFHNISTNDDIKDLKNVFASKSSIILQVTDKGRAQELYDLPSHVEYLPLFFQGMTPEQFEVFIPIFVKDESVRKVLIEIFREAKLAEQPLTHERLKSALEQINSLFTDFENPTGILR